MVYVIIDIGCNNEVIGKVVGGTQMAFLAWNFLEELSPHSDHLSERMIRNCVVIAGW